MSLIALVNKAKKVEITETIKRCSSWAIQPAYEQPIKYNNNSNNSAFGPGPHTSPYGNFEGSSQPDTQNSMDILNSGYVNGMGRWHNPN